MWEWFKLKHEGARTIQETKARTCENCLKTQALGRENSLRNRSVQEQFKLKREGTRTVQEIVVRMCENGLKIEASGHENSSKSQSADVWEWIENRSM